MVYVCFMLFIAQSKLNTPTPQALLDAKLLNGDTVSQHLEKLIIKFLRELDLKELDEVASAWIGAKLMEGERSTVRDPRDHKIGSPTYERTNFAALLSLMGGQTVISVRLREPNNREDD